MKKIVAALIAISMLLLIVNCADAFTPQTGHWWNPNESGTGYNIDVNNGVLVITIYSYKTNGDSEWYLAAGSMSADQHQFVGTLDKYRNGQCISCPYTGRPTMVGNDGAIFINFLSETEATLTLPGGRITSIQPFFSNSAAPNNGLNGTYQLTRTSLDYLNGSLLDTTLGNFSAGGTMVISGNALTQSVTVTSAGRSITLTISGTFADLGAYLSVVEQNGASARVVMVNRSPILITERNLPSIGTAPPVAEVDQWTRVGQVTKAAPPEPGKQRATATGPVGGLVGTGLETM